MKNERNGKADPGAETLPFPIPSYREGSVQSVGSRPSGRDESDRSGEGTLPAETTSAPEPGRDAFVSSEVSDKSSVPGKDPRTRS
jgi:hypothetical protein